MEDNQQIDKPFIITGVRVPDKDGNISGNHFAGYNGSIKVALGKPKQEFRGSSWKMEFKTVISNHVHARLLGEVVTRIRDNFKSEPNTHSYVDFPKTLTAYSLERLMERYDEVIDDYLWLVSNDNKPRKKVLYVRWRSKSIPQYKSSYNSAEMGSFVSQEFVYFMGYFNGSTHFDVNFKPYNHKEIDATYKIIDWTEEREQFLKKILANFYLIKDRLDEFFGNMNSDNIDVLIENIKPNLILNG